MYAFTHLQLRFQEWGRGQGGLQLQAPRGHFCLGSGGDPDFTFETVGVVVRIVQFLGEINCFVDKPKFYVRRNVGFSQKDLLSSKIWAIRYGNRGVSMVLWILELGVG